MTPLQITQISLEFWGAFITFACAIATLMVHKVSPRRSFTLATLLFVNTLLLISDGLAYLYRGNPSPTGYYVVRISNFLVFALIPVMIITVAHFIRILIELSHDTLSLRWSLLIGIPCALHLLLLLVSQFTGFIYYFDSANYYHRTDGIGFAITSILGFAELLILAAMVIYHRSSIDLSYRIALLVYITLPSVSSIYQVFHYGLSLNNIMATISVLLIFFTSEVRRANTLYANMQELHAQELALKNHELILSQKDKELAEAQLQISLSQIQPHFVFNALGSIEQLCRIDAARASEATHYFARYLRNNLHAMNIADVSTFTDELSHLRSYVWLEKMRFGDDLVMTEDIQCDDFRLPTLTLQPLVQYFIQHSLMSSDEGVLHIRIQTYQTAGNYYIVLADDGVPGDIEFAMEESFSESVLTNIRDRLQMLCGGSIIHETALGRGTTFTIILQKTVQH